MPAPKISGLRVALVSCLVIAGSMCARASSAGQATGTGTIEGKVADESGAPMPGVTVTATSPALQLPQVAVVTTQDGSYRLLDLPAGLYHIVYELQGFQSVVREELRLNVGFVARVDLVLKVGSIQESLTVKGQSPVIDTSTTMVSTNITAEKLQSVPTTQTIYEILGLTPAVRLDNTPDVGGSQLALQIGYRNYGLRNGQLLLLDGVDTRTTDTGQATFTDVKSWAEIKVNAVAQDASIQLPGVNMLMVVKGGGNDFHGSGAYAGETKGLEGHNIDSQLNALGFISGSSIDTFNDLFGDIGGPIRRDKLWFYVGLRDQKVTNDVLGYSGEHHLQNTNQSVKLTYQPTQAYRIIGFVYHNLKSEPDRNGSPYMQQPSTIYYSFPNAAQKAEFQATPNSRLLVNVMFNHFTYDAVFGTRPEADVAGNPATFDQTSNLYTGPNRYSFSHQTLQRYQTNAKMTFVPIDKHLGGLHTVQLGLQAYPYQQGAAMPLDLPAGQYELIYHTQNGVPHVPFEIATYWQPSLSTVNGNEYSLFAADTWRLNRLTLDVGVRWDRYRSFLEAQSSPATEFGPAISQPALDMTALHHWWPIVPRLGATYDMFGDGKFVLKSFYGRFGNTPNYNFAQAFDTNSPLITTTLRWTDPTNCGCYVPGTVNLDPNGPAFVSRTGGPNAIPNPNLTQPFTDEVTVSAEKEVAADTSVRAGYVFMRQSNLYSQINPLRPASAWNIPVVRQDPGPDGILGTADDGGQVTLYTYPAALAGGNFVGTELVNRPSGTADFYNSFEFTVNRRGSGSRPWDVLGSIVVTKNHRWLTAPGQASATNSANVLSPNDSLFPLDTTWDEEFKMSASYRLPHEVLVAAVYREALGNPGYRTYIFSAIPQASTLTIPLETFGSERDPSMKLLNVKLSKKLTFAGSRRISLDLDLFNALNINTPTGIGSSSATSAVSYASGPTFGHPLNIVPPRLLRGGVTVAF